MTSRTSHNDITDQAAPARPRVRARLYVAAQRGFKRGVALIDALWTAAWLGVLSRQDLHAIDAARYTGSNYEQDAHNLRGFFPWEAQAIDAYFPREGKLLVLGAGGGREILALARRGYTVEGYESLPALVAYGSDLLAREGYPGTLQVLDRDTAPPTGGPYHGIVVGWGLYMLIAGTAKRIAFLQDLCPLIHAEAPILLSFRTRSHDTPRARIVHTVAGGLRRLLRGEPVEAGDDLEPTYVHRFNQAELEAELQAAGLRLVYFQPHGPGPYDTGYAIARLASSPTSMDVSSDDATEA